MIIKVIAYNSMFMRKRINLLLSTHRLKLYKKYLQTTIQLIGLR